MLAALALVAPLAGVPASTASASAESAATVLSIIGDYSLLSHVAADGLRYWMAQDRHLPAEKRAVNCAVIRRHSDVTEASYRFSFLTEGLATLGEYLMVARNAQEQKGDGAFGAALVRQLDRTDARGGAFWTRARSDPPPFTLFNGPPTYCRPGARQLEEQFQGALPSQSDACHRRLTTFFTQWFDTGYPRGGGEHRPSIIGPRSRRIRLLHARLPPLIGRPTPLGTGGGSLRAAAPSWSAG